MNAEVVGRTYDFDLGALKVRYTFESETEATFVVSEGAGLAPDGHTETVRIDLKKIRDGVYLNSWTEASGATVSHVEDFANGVVYSNVTVDGILHPFVGSISEFRAESDQTLEERNTQVVLTAMRELFAEKDVSAVDRYWAEPYVQHSPQMPNGLDVLRSAALAAEGFSWDPQRVAAQGDLVFTHSVVHGWAPVPVAIVDIFRLEAGRIVEHWDVVQEIVEAAESANGNPMV